MSNFPSIFLSATRKDLEKHRAAAARAITRAGFHAVTMENFASEDSAPLDKCLGEVERCDALVVLVAHRYGWIPPAQDPPRNKSITWLECLHAREKCKIPIFPFVVDPDYEWDRGLKEDYRLIEAHKNRENLAKVSKEVAKSEAQLAKFKSWLDTVFTRTLFTTPESVETGVLAALANFASRNAPAASGRAAHAASREAYLDELREATRWIDIRGLIVGGATVYRAEIRQLYVTLKTAGSEKGVPLEKALASRRLVIQGDAGSGKTTFVRRMAFDLASKRTGGFPIWIRIAALDEHIAKSSGVPGTPLTNSAKWIPHFLGAHTRLTEAAATAILTGTEGVLFLDGLDEAPNETRRRGLAKLLADAARLYPDCRIVVTTRPAAYQGDAVLAGFETTRIEELDDDGVNQFLELWSGFLYPDNKAGAQTHRQSLRRALDGKPEIKRLARNPVMLTALAVLQQNNRVLPEQRAELYESILDWLSKARDEKPGRLGAVQCLTAMGRLAWGMHTGQKGRVARIGRPDAARLLGFGDGPEALVKLADEELDSGIIARRESDIAFWHLTFQEYLAARDLAGKPDGDQYQELFRDKRLYHPEWRETVLLFAGVLATQGTGKVNALFHEITGKLGAKARFHDKARCVGLLAAIAADLRPSSFTPDCPAYTEMVKEMARLFTKGGAEGLDLQTRVAAAEALGVEAHPAIYLPNDKRYWVDLPGGKITLRDTRKSAEVKPFQLGKNPVTVWEYSKFVEEGGPVPPDWEDQKLHPTRPVVSVSWHDAVAYCKWAGCRLATEEEWEFAARGEEGREWAWGNTEPTDRHANIEMWVRSPSPVGMFPEGNSPDGLIDLSGNSREWTSSLWKKGDTGRVVRGGSWIHLRGYARGAFRSCGGPGLRDFNIGFRCARTKD